MISIIFHLDGNPHEIIIKDTKYYVKEIYSADKRSTQQLTVSDYLLNNSTSVGISMWAPKLTCLAK